MGGCMGNDSLKTKAEVTKERREICSTCEHRTTMIGVDVCNKCGCSIWGKTLIMNAKCPEGKWYAEQI